MPKEIEIREFAERVERLCDFLLSRVKRMDDSNDLKVIAELKEEAANIQANYEDPIDIAGLDNYMRGLSPITQKVES